VISIVRKDLLEKELEFYKKTRIELKPVKFNKNKFYNLAKKYKYSSMTENSYCCYGEEKLCWQELIEEGNWDLTQIRITDIIKTTLKEIKHIARDRSQGNRCYMYKSKDECLLFIYARDTEIETDYHIWFSNKKLD